MSNNKEFTINTTKRLFFRQYLELMKVFPPLNILRSKELDILAELLYYNDHYSSLNIEDRKKIIYNTSTRNDIRKSLNMSEASFNNNLSILRKQGVIKNNVIAAGLIVVPDDGFTIGFNFKIQQ
jgi:DNA-binding MarR family transcriptional regulator